MKTIFKKGDRVFCYNHGGWGNVIKIFSDDNPFPIYCSFDLGNCNFTKDGRFYEGGPSILSFTEYTLEGFSQERPEELPKKGQIVWGRDEDYQSWHIYHFSHKTEDGIYHLSSDNKRNMYQLKQITTENPYENN
jgi:hypothetical protein